MPDDLRWAYTRCGAIDEAQPFYVDDTVGGKGIWIKYRADRIKPLLVSAAQVANLPSPAKSLGRQGWVAEALSRIRPQLTNSTVLVVGSQQPTFETLLLAYGAAKVVTVEYQNLTYEHDQMQTVTPGQVASDPASFRHRFDVALSISSYDHDGLGRYGDPLCPDGDLLSMDELRTFYLKQGSGIAVVNVPVGPDAVVWNLHRRYGRVRLPLLLEGWEEVGRVGWEAHKLTEPAPVTKSYEPVFILRAPLHAGAPPDGAQAALHDDDAATTRRHGAHAAGMLGHRAAQAEAMRMQQQHQEGARDGQSPPPVGGGRDSDGTGTHRSPSHHRRAPATESGGGHRSGGPRATHDPSSGVGGGDGGSRGGTASKEAPPTPFRPGRLAPTPPPQGNQHGDEL